MNKNLKQTIGLGVGSMAGMGAMGALSGMPGMPSQAGNVAGIASTGLVLANVGQMTKTARSIVPKKTYAHGGVHDERIRRIIG